jgi:hypothetical protein
MSKDLKVIKGGKLGTGILIEQDAGYIDTDDKRNQTFINEVNKIDVKGMGGSAIVPDPLILYVVLQKWGVKNRNGRIYPEPVLKQQNEAYQQLIRENRAFGELDHPETSIIAGDRVSHRILETWWEGKTLMGKMEILMSPAFVKQGIVCTMGDYAANIIRQGGLIGVSSRGVGSLQEVAGNAIVQDDFELICWDIVTSPSTPGSWMFNNRQEAKPFMESEKKEKSLLIDNLNKFLSK